MVLEKKSEVIGTAEAIAAFALAKVEIALGLSRSPSWSSCLNGYDSDVARIEGSELQPIDSRAVEPTDKCRHCCLILPV